MSNNDNLVNNFDGVFFRDVLAGISYFMYDTIKIEKTVDDKTIEVNVPIYPSAGISENFIKDFYVNNSRNCEHPLINNIASNVLPSGRILVDDSLSIDDMQIINNNVMTVKNEQYDNDFFNEIVRTYGRRTIINIKISFVISIKCTSLIERFKILEKIIKVFHKNRVFYFSSGGVDRIPTNISLSNNYNLDNKKSFKFGNVDQKYLLDISFAVNTYMIVDNNRETFTDKNKDKAESNVSVN